MAQDQALRLMFEQVPNLYDRVRPRYPPQLFDDLVELVRLRPADRVLEIGCGTGQATLPLAERDLRITCVEIGPQLAAFTHAKLAAFRSVEVINADFENWQPTKNEFDAVVALTAWHWIAPDLAYAKAASVLREGGRLAIVGTHHVLTPEGDDFFNEVQEDYEAVVPDDPATKAGGPKPPDSVADLSDEIAASGLFRPTTSRRYVWDIVYDADEYVGLLNTYSGHRALDELTRERLLTRIRRRILQRPGGRVRKTYLAILNVAGSAG